MDQNPSESPRLRPIDTTCLESLMSWFPAESDLRGWAGPGFRFPFDGESFEADLNLDRLASRALISHEGELLAFGQYYRRLDRCHLGRLAVAPAHRGKGLAAQLMQALIAEGQETLNVSESSLFVLADNRPALSAYRRFGFRAATYPGELPLANCLYLVRPGR